MTIEDQSFFILAPNVNHLITLMEAVVEEPGITARARHTGPNFVARGFTWKHAVDNLLDVFGGVENRAKINRLACELL